MHHLLLERRFHFQVRLGRGLLQRYQVFIVLEASAPVRRRIHTGRLLLAARNRTILLELDFVFEALSYFERCNRIAGQIRVLLVLLDLLPVLFLDDLVTGGEIFRLNRSNSLLVLFEQMLLLLGLLLLELLEHQLLLKLLLLPKLFKLFVQTQALIQQRIFRIRNVRYRSGFRVGLVAVL